MKNILPLLAVAILAAITVSNVAHADSTQTPKPVPYALKTCFITGDAIGGDMGKPVVFTYQGQEIKLCCKKCKKQFDANPEKGMKKYNAALAKAGKQ